MLKLLIYIAISLTLYGAIFYVYPKYRGYLLENTKISYHNDLSKIECCLDIAHAGGVFKGLFYTNSLNALNQSYKAGRRVFEIDFITNNSDEVLLSHNTDDEYLGAEEFIEWNGEYIRLDLVGLNAWLKTHPDATIVTDAKNDFERFLKNLEETTSPEFINQRYVFQVYSLVQLEEVMRDYPHAHPILTLYRMPLERFDLFNVVKGLEENVAVTMPLSFAKAYLKKLRKLNPRRRFYVHGHPSKINDHDIQAQLKIWGASGFYID